MKLRNKRMIAGLKKAAGELGLEEIEVMEVAHNQYPELRVTIPLPAVEIEGYTFRHLSCQLILYDHDHFYDDQFCAWLQQDVDGLGLEEVHPHADSGAGDMCVENTFSEELEERRYENAIANMIAAVSSYVPGAAFRPVGMRYCYRCSNETDDSYSCRYCEETNLCWGCVTYCSECDEMVCWRCFTYDNRLCPACQEARNQDEAERLEQAEPEERLVNELLESEVNDG